MDPDQRVADYNRGLIAGKEHATPSPETVHMITDLKSQLDRIEEQTSKTNGRVTRLEVWQAYVLGFCACLSIVVLSVGVPLLFKVLE